MFISTNVKGNRENVAAIEGGRLHNVREYTGGQHISPATSPCSIQKCMMGALPNSIQSGIPRGSRGSPRKVVQKKKIFRHCRFVVTETSYRLISS